MNCCVCRSKISERHVAGYIEYHRFDPKEGHNVSPVVCMKCFDRLGTVAYCPLCDKGYKLPKGWASHFPRGYANWQAIICEEHANSPNIHCHVCERLTEFGNYSISPLGRAYCNKCMASVTRCGSRECRTLIHPEDTVASHSYKRVHYCKYCYLRRLPKWLKQAGISHESMWEYKPGCPCKVCSYLNGEAPKGYPKGPAGLEVTHECAGCQVGANITHLEEKAGGLYCHYCSVSGFTKCSKCELEAHKHDVHNVHRELGLWCRKCVAKLPGNRWLCDIQCKTWFGVGMNCPCGGVYAYNYVPQNPPFLTARGERASTEEVPYLGLELEVEALVGKPSRRDGARLVSELAPWAYPMHDGSLSGSREDGTGGEFGFEVVTYPFTMGWLNENMDSLVDLTTKLGGLGFRSWESERCGMHIHISRSPMTDAHQMKFIRFILGHSNLCVAVGQRGYRSRGVERYASFNAENRRYLINKVRKYENPGVPNHRVALNTNKEATLEGRWFRGSLNPESIRRNLEFMHSVWYFTRKFGMTSANEFNYISWLRGTPERTQYAVLLDFLERNYVTRPWKGVRSSR